MDIIQILIFVVIIAVAIVQQISKAKKAAAVPSPQEVLADMFPNIEEEEQTISPKPMIRKPQPSFKEKEAPKPAPSAGSKVNASPTGSSRIKLSTREEARRAFIYSEIFNRKY